MPSRLSDPAERDGRSFALFTLALVFAVLLACAFLTALVPPTVVLDDARASRDYDDQALAWLDGRWDVPLTPSGFERFLVAGRYYMYFGPTPALLRLPFAALLAAFPAKAGFFSVFLAVSIGLWAALQVFEETSGEPPGPLAVVALAGLPLVIASRFAVYHEAIAWGAAFALLAALQALRYLRSPSLPRLASAAAAALLAAFAREIWMLGMIALLVAMGAAALVRAPPPDDPHRGPARLKEWMGLPEVEWPGRHAALALAAAGLILFLAAAIHKAKFGGWGFVPPIERHIVFSRDPARLARIGHGLFHLANLRTGLYNYLSPTTVRLAADFPWIHPVAEPRLFPEARLDGFEHLMGLPHVAGALLLSALLGIAAAVRGRARRDALLVLAAAAASASACFFFVGLCGRYLYDFFPALVVGGALGWNSLRRLPMRWARTGLVALAFYNLAASAALALTIQRVAGPLPGRRAVQALCDRVDRAILRPAARLDDGSCAMPGARRVRLRIRAAGPPMDGDDPVVVIGAPGAATLVTLRRFVDGTGAFAFHAWGSPQTYGRRFPIEPGRWRDVDVRFDVPGMVRVLQDGLPMLVHSGPVLEVLGRTVWLGRNAVGEPAVAQRFAGDLGCVP